MKINVTKRNIKSALTVLTVLFNFIILALPSVSASHQTASGVESFFANGFTFAFGECPPVCDAMKNWLTYYSRFHFFVSIALILVLCVVAVIQKGCRFGFFGVWTSAVAFLTSLIYMVNGLVADHLASFYASPLYYTHFTLAPVGFGLVAFFVIANLFVHFFMKNDED